MAGGAFPLAHEGFYVFPHAVGEGFPVPPLQLLEDAGERLVVVRCMVSLPALVGDMEHLVGAVVKDVHYLFRKVLERCVQGEVIGLGQCLEPAVVPGRLRSERQDAPLVVGKAHVRHYKMLVILHGYAKSCTGWAGAVWVVEGEKPWLQFRNTDVAVWT